eukprot:113196-Amphidinium_carterae.1
MVFDYAYNIEEEKENRKYGTSLVIADSQTGFVKAFASGTKRADEFAVQQVVDFCAQLGHDAIELRCDGEPATIALQTKVQDLRLKKGLRTVLSTGKTRDSASMGLAETSIRWWRAKLRTFKCDLEAKYGVTISPSSPLWAWMCRHAAWVTSRYKLQQDGVTSYHSAYGSPYRGEVVPYGETVLAKLPLSSGSRLTIGNRKIPKHKTSW